MPFIVPALIAGGIAGGLALAGVTTATAILGSEFLGGFVPAFAPTAVPGGVSPRLRGKCLS